MTKWLYTDWLEYALTQLSAEAESVSVLATFPVTYFNCVKGDTWDDLTAYSLGDVVHPAVWNDFVYECVVAGTSGASEPPWETTQDNEFTDGTVTWKTHENYSLAVGPVGSSVITTEAFGKRLTFESTTGALTHTAGTVTHTALVSDTNQELLYVTESETEKVEDDDVLSGRILTINEIILDANDVA